MVIYLKIVASERFPSLAKSAEYSIDTCEDGPSLTADARCEFPCSQLFASFSDTQEVEDTETIFWSNLEAGLSLLAVNLPSLWAIINKTSPERILASLRSIISLRSLRSNHVSHASWSHTRISDGETPAHLDESDAKLASRRANYELQDVKDVESREAIPRSQTSTFVTKEAVREMV
jgi:hypothetical protein